MSQVSFYSFIAERQGDPAIRLLAETAATVRADAEFLQRSSDIASATFFAKETPVPLDEGALEQVLARIELHSDLDRHAKDAAADKAEISALPSPVREAAFAALKKRGWRFGGFGIRRLPLLAGRDTQAELMRIEPGHGAARHNHDADELTLVLTGAYDDGHARYAAGDISLARPGFSHLPTAEAGEVCYVLAVTYGPPKFDGLFGFLQRTIGFPWSPTAQP
jgi:putative transcriptional regulator